MMVPLKEVRGAVSGAGIAVPSRARPMVLATPLTVGPMTFASATGLCRLVTTPRASSSVSPGVREASWPFGAVSSGGASASREHMKEIALAPDTPSTVQWCILVKTTRRSSPDSVRKPSMT